MPVIRFEGSSDSIEVGKGANLRRGLQLHAQKTPGICFGLGMCGMCWVEVVEGQENLSPPSKMEQLCLTQPIKKGRRLSCQARVYGDCVVRRR